MDAGLQAIDYLEQWTRKLGAEQIPEDRGFTWWASGHAQRIWAEEPIRVDGLRMSRIQIRTDFVRATFNQGEHYPQVTVLSDELLEHIAFMSAEASVSCVVRKPGDPAIYQLACSAYVDDESLKWIGSFLGWAALIQASEAPMMAGAFEDHSVGLPVTSEHPKRGTPGPEINLFGSDKSLRSEEPSAWAGSQMVQTGKMIKQHPFCLHATYDENGLTAEFPFGERKSVLRLTTTDKNPMMENGLTCRLELPTGWEGTDGQKANAAIKVSEQELASNKNTRSFGSWSSGESALSHRSFYPNFFYNTWLLNDIAMASVMRSQWVAKDFFGFDNPPSAAERFLRRLGLKKG